MGHIIRRSDTATTKKILFNNEKNCKIGRPLNYIRAVLGHTDINEFASKAKRGYYQNWEKGNGRGTDPNRRKWFPIIARKGTDSNRGECLKILKLVKEEQIQTEENYFLILPEKEQIQTEESARKYQNW